MKKYCRFIAALSLVTTLLGCNGEEDMSPDADPGDANQLGFDADESSDTTDDTLAWPEQEIDDPPLHWDWSMPSVDQGLKVLVANLGNIDLLRCSNVAYNLCWTEAEEIIASEIARHAPDLVLLQEVLNPAQCDAVEDPDDDHACHPDHRADEEEQVRRLLGQNFTIACDDRQGFECVGARVDRVAIDGCNDGDLCRGLARTAAPVDDCDPGFTFSAVTVHTSLAGLDNVALDVVNGHPPSDGAGRSQGRSCRQAYLQQVFGEQATIVENDAVIVAGDLNFDPYRGSATALDVELWNQFVGTRFEDDLDDPQRFTYHSGITEHDPPYWTSPLVKKTLDHLVSNSLRGRCITLGAAPGKAPLDHALGSQLERLDHLALTCLLHR